eukprot:TRINITY_DN31870_c0_g1_i1.p1 TRINITY_DN31870_c0_g1~~TRINITY_DN31870_c0_g1_i1.p1  ORF type:complete len:641 (+),score=63.39 TRINITY_DN31870_c0_g1_i1:100-2022(+)
MDSSGSKDVLRNLGLGDSSDDDLGTSSINLEGGRLVQESTSVATHAAVASSRRSRRGDKRDQVRSIPSEGAKKLLRPSRSKTSASLSRAEPVRGASNSSVEYSWLSTLSVPAGRLRVFLMLLSTLGAASLLLPFFGSMGDASPASVEMPGAPPTLLPVSSLRRSLDIHEERAEAAVGKTLPKRTAMVLGGTRVQDDSVQTNWQEKQGNVAPQDVMRTTGPQTTSLPSSTLQSSTMFPGKDVPHTGSNLPLGNPFSVHRQMQMQARASRPARQVTPVWTCDEIKKRYGSNLKKDFGDSPPPYWKQMWDDLNCMERILNGTDELTKYQLRLLANLSAITPANCTAQKLQPIERKEAFPLVTICVATTTRHVNVKNLKWQNLALFRYLLPSFVKTAECGFSYAIVLGYDKGDPFFDNGDWQMQVVAWFDEHVRKQLASRGMNVTLTPVGVVNPARKPGPVFNAMAKVALFINTSYIYRVNDDTEMVTPWVGPYTRALSSLGNFGVVGPTCWQGKTSILTHDFTHRTHMHIFNNDYYPLELADWWMDDWASLVYPWNRTLKALNVIVVHHVHHHGQRYNVEKKTWKHLNLVLARGREQVRQFMRTRYPFEANSSELDKLFNFTDDVLYLQKRTTRRVLQKRFLP